MKWHLIIDETFDNVIGKVNNLDDYNNDGSLLIQ